MRRPWLPYAKRFAGRDAGVMDRSHGTRKVVLHTEGVDRGRNGRDGNAYWLADYVASRNIGYHFTIDRQGRVGQIYAADRGSRALEDHADHRWSPNRQGVVAIQVCFAGVQSASEVADWPLLGWDRLLRFFDEWGVPRKTHVNWHDPARSVGDWFKSGYVSHAHAPEQWAGHTDGAHAPIRRLLRTASPRA